jgi:DsbC/DsbD-like thiol-disulfide interchange protein
MLPRKPSVLVWVLAAGCLFPASAAAQSKRSDAVVKIEPAAGPIGRDGRQQISVKLTIDPTWHLTANPAGNEAYENCQVKISVAGQQPLKDVQISYPAGKEMQDEDGGRFRGYEGEVVLRAIVLREAGDTAPLELTLFLQACQGNKCLASATVKRTIR